MKPTVNLFWPALLLAGECLAFAPREVCLGELGCFGNSGVFYDLLRRPVALLPDRPESIRTTFRLYTLHNLLLPEILELDNSALNSSSLSSSTTTFDPELETKIIVHGFREAEEDWMINLKDAFLARDSLNVVTVDWSGGSGIPYTQAASNTRVVGAQIALLIARLQNHTGLDLNKVHLIGFSLGAHICGYAGERLNKVRRITGLDPAGPMFEDLPAAVRLDPSDAQFVDAIHTDGRHLLQLAFGSFSPVGQVDFYPNGGLKQPGCPRNVVETVSYASLGALLRGLDQANEEVSCRHERAHHLFLETVRNGEGCTPVAYPCRDWDAFRDGLCTSCGPEGKECGVMGSRAEEFKTDSGVRPGVEEEEEEESRAKLYLMTAGGRPFCFFHYSVRVRIPESQEGGGGGPGLSAGLSLLPAVSVGSNYGQLEISMTGDKRVSAHGLLGLGNQVFKAGTEYPFLFASEQDLGEVKSLVLRWRPAAATSGIISFKFSVSQELAVADVLVQPMALSDRSARTSTFMARQRSGGLVTAAGLLMTRVGEEERR